MLALLASGVPSYAETVVETALRWDLLGTWRVTCGYPTTFFDPQETYVVRGPNLFFENDPGNGKETFPVQSAAIQNDDRIELMLVDLKFKTRRKNILERNGNGRIRLLTSWDADTETVYVRDARMANGLRKFDWQERCR